VPCRLNNATGPHALRFLYAVTLVVVVEVARRERCVIEARRYGSSRWCGRASTLKIESAPVSGRRELRRLRYSVCNEERMRWRESCEHHEECTGCATVRRELRLRKVSVGEEDIGMGDQLRDDGTGGHFQKEVARRKVGCALPLYPVSRDDQYPRWKHIENPTSGPVRDRPFLEASS
jgi:hypothetical protein